MLTRWFPEHFQWSPMIGKQTANAANAADATPVNAISDTDEHRELDQSASHKPAMSPPQDTSVHAHFKQLQRGRAAPVSGRGFFAHDQRIVHTTMNERKLQSQRDKFANLNKTLEDQVNIFSQRSKRVEKENEELKAANKKLKIDLNNTFEVAENQIEEERRLARGHLEENQKLLRTYRRYENRIEELEGQIRKLQSNVFRSVEAAQWAPQSVEDSDRELSSLLQDIRDWSATYSNLPASNVLDLKSGSIHELLPKLQERGCIVGLQSSVEQLYWALHRNERLRKCGKVSSLLLSSAVAAQVMLEVIGDPFCAFGGDDLKGRIGVKSYHTTLQDLSVQIGRGDEAGAEAWRCQLLRLLDPVTNADDPNIRKLKELAANSREALAKRVAAAITDEFSNLLIPRSSANKACAALEEIVHEAANLSWKFWTRKFKIEVLHIRALAGFTKAGDVRKLWFSSTSQAMDAAVVHNLDLDDDATALDGREVLLLCSPLIQARGTAEGTDYDHGRTWKKAVVYMG